MSCIRFNTDPQRRAMRQAAADGEALRFLSPAMDAGKVARLRTLGSHERPGIRQSAASNRAAPEDLLAALAADPEAAVRAEVARNESTPVALLVALAADRDARVRCWAALATTLPPEALRGLAADPDAQVRRLAGWRLASAELPA